MVQAARLPGTKEQASHLHHGLTNCPHDTRLSVSYNRLILVRPRAGERVRGDRPFFRERRSMMTRLPALCLLALLAPGASPSHLTAAVGIGPLSPTTVRASTLSRRVTAARPRFDLP